MKYDLTTRLYHGSRTEMVGNCMNIEYNTKHVICQYAIKMNPIIK